MVRCAAHSDTAGEDRFLLGSKRIATTINYEHAWNAVAFVAQSFMTIKDQAERSKELEILDAAADDLGHKHLLAAVIDGGLKIAITPDAQASQDRIGKDKPAEYTPESLSS